MKYQECVEPAQAPDAAADVNVRRCDANINPETGLATDYLNHFNEAIMLLEMLSACPDCIDDFLAWRPMSYRKIFRDFPLQGTRSGDRPLQRRRAGPARIPGCNGRHHDRRAGNDANRDTRKRIVGNGPPGLSQADGRARRRVINGGFDLESTEPPAAQAAVDALMKKISP